MNSNSNVLTVTTGADGVLLVAGDVDMAGGPILEQAMVERDAELAAGRGGDLVVDLAGVHFIDSSGLRCLIASARRAATRKARLELRSVGSETTRLLEITGTMDQFTIATRGE
jgi:anti-sigma B factor antagonist